MTALNDAGNVSIVCVGVNHVVLISYFLKSFRSRGAPTSAPNSPRERYPGGLDPESTGPHGVRVKVDAETDGDLAV